jgi:hypothetical protein
MEQINKPKTPIFSRFTEEQRKQKKNDRNKAYYENNKERLRKLNVDNYHKRKNKKDENLEII